jgi:hypothetical protein
MRLWTSVLETISSFRQIASIVWSEVILLRERFGLRCIGTLNQPIRGSQRRNSDAQAHQELWLVFCSRRKHDHLSSNCGQSCNEDKLDLNNVTP